ncbi:MAG: hypothetical protein WBH22_12655 [Pseudomonas mandelii]|jgi:hypothetical protein|uniref:Uncharacterized protein n=2 Tax=Pseudomonas fluorescens group TaxID=136843 RepID=A0AB36CUP7_9PSED|nr:MULTISPECIES: hypothetical protein [Pseudomonas]MBA4359732.1 hypothetical protein [Pseudomonas sp.]MBU0524669.1 hypothetical protein [Gammaproteobacteria bacterium]MDF9884514.1 hypothetical protein [Pseudomonas silensiensis]MBU0820619.1 hypothetical protein [Gammaproteobacteria bacterium]MBU0845203.1 hypothetical protein [Gammaproteobacteria bacterium]
MLQNDRKNLELDKLQVEIRRFIAETRKFMAEESKLRQEAFWYPFAVGAGLVTAVVAAVGLWFKL